MKIAALPLFALLSLAAVAGCKGGNEASTTSTMEKDGVKAVVEISDPWCRPTPNGAQAGACYLTIESNVANRVTGVATPLASNAMIHDMTMDGGMMKMSEMADGLPLAPDQEVVLAPGGKHLMLMGLTAPLTEGTAVPLTLTFSATPAMTVEAPVRQPKP
ncbi:copper chaperone PCu(A)C [Brevundimonas sp.]|uniref:copper chaperone PCu(A)C n=1 Tax=Brevundimonas sp. TaxID=1871086 RepID=UPI00378506EF